MAGKGVFFYLWKSTALSEDSTQILKALYKLCPLLIPLYIVYIYICTVLHISKPWRINFSQVSRIRVLLSGSGSNFFPESRSGSAKNRPDPGFKVRIRIGEKARIRIRNTVFYLFTTEYVHTVLYFWTILYCTVYTKYDLEI